MWLGNYKNLFLLFFYIQYYIYLVVSRFLQFSYCMCQLPFQILPLFFTLQKHCILQNPSPSVFTIYVPYSLQNLESSYLNLFTITICINTHRFTLILLALNLRVGYLFFSNFSLPFSCDLFHFLYVINSKVYFL